MKRLIKELLVSVMIFSFISAIFSFVLGYAIVRELEAD